MKYTTKDIDSERSVHYCIVKELQGLVQFSNKTLGILHRN